MRRFSPASASAIAVALVVAGCASTPAPPSPTTTKAPTLTPTPTPEAVFVGPAERPPTVFGGDCALALTVEEIAATTGLIVGEPASESNGTVANVGGLNCRWQADSGSVLLQILPVAGLGDAELSPSDVAYYFQDCDPNWVCASLSSSADLWIASSFQTPGGMTRDGVDGWGAALGAQVDAAYAAHSAEPWVRDTTGWWPVLDCVAAADEIAGGTAGITGAAAGSIDPPTPGYAMADAASHHSHCALSELDTVFLDFEAYSGTAWEIEGDEGFAPVDGVPDIRYKVEPETGPYGGAPFVMTDGVNVLRADIKATSGWTVEEIAQALAQAASDW